MQVQCSTSQAGPCPQAVQERRSLCWLRWSCASCHILITWSVQVGANGRQSCAAHPLRAAVEH